MQREVIDLFHARAKRIGESVLKKQPSGGRWVNDWSTYPADLSEDLTWEIVKAGHLRFKRAGTNAQHAWIEFENITATKIIGEPVFHTPVSIGTSPLDSNTINVNNSHSSVKVFPQYSLEFTHQTSASHTVGVELLTEIKTKIGTGTASPVQAELQFRTQLTAKYEASFKSVSTTSRESLAKFEVPANTRASIVMNRSKSTFEQRVECDCFLDSKIRGYSAHDFDHWWESCSELDEVMKGLAPETKKLATWYRAEGRALNDADREYVIGTERIHLDKTVRYNNARVGDIIITEPSA